MQNRNKFASEKTLSTKSVILETSLRLINENGMMNFRVESLSVLLGLSQGNISYHFSKKEVMARILWSNFLDEFSSVVETISSILDIKQTFLTLRELLSVVYKYRGVVMFVSSDSRVLQDETYKERDFYDMTKQMFSGFNHHLYANGYLKDDKISKIELDSQTLVMRWWINKSLIENCKEKMTIEQMINHNALLILFSFYENMNAKGREEFEFIAERVYSDQV